MSKRNASGAGAAGKAGKGAAAAAAAAAAGSKAEGGDEEKDDSNTAEAEDGEKAEGEEGEQAEGGDGGDDEEEEEKEPTAAEAAQRMIGATAERKRISGILGAMEAKGREGLARHLAFNTGVSQAEAIATLKASPSESRGALGAHMATQGNVDVGAGGGEPAGAQTEVQKTVASIVGLHQRLTGRVPKKSAA